jgi:uncharacterized protein
MNFNELYKKLEKIVKDKLKSSPKCHDWEHTQRVIHNAKLLLKYENDADAEIIIISALLHDIARADEIDNKGAQCHALKGSEMADEILKCEDIEESIRNRIVKCVKKHRFRSSDIPETIEEKVVYDADKLDSIGAVGLGRAFLFAGRAGAKVHNTKEEALNSESYSENDTAYREFLVKLRYIPGKMMTNTGRKIAKERVAYMNEFFERLNKEIFSQE